MKINLNGVEGDFEGETLDQLWEQERVARDIETSRGVAIAVNGVVVRKTEWSVRKIAPDDRINIIRAMSGG